MKHQDCHTLL